MRPHLTALAALLLVPAASRAQTTTSVPITLSGEVRSRSELDRAAGASGDAFTFLRSRLGLAADPVPSARVVLQVQDSRVLGTEGSAATAAVAQDQLELHQAYLQASAPWRSLAFTLRAGRQEIALANERLVGAVNWSNLGRSFDGVRLLVAPSAAPAPWSGTAFAAIVSEQGRRFGATPAPARPPRDHAVGGIAVTAGTPAGTMVDATLLLDAGGQYRAYDAADRGTADLRVRVPRLLGTPLRVELEGAVQTGHQLFVGPAAAPVAPVAQRVSAWLGAARVGLPVGKSTVTLGADLVSGDESPADERYSAFATLYATNHPFYGLLDLIADPATSTRDRGLVDLLATTATPLSARVALRTELHHFALATGGDRPLGWEADVVLPVRLNAATTLELGGARFHAERGAESVGLATDGGTTSWTYLQLLVSF